MKLKHQRKVNLYDILTYLEDLGTTAFDTSASWKSIKFKDRTKHFGVRQFRID